MERISCGVVTQDEFWGESGMAVQVASASVNPGQISPTQSPIHIVNIVGTIEGITLLPQQFKVTRYEDIVPKLVAMELSPAIKGVLVILNTVGGDVEAGLAIAEAIAGLSKPSASLVLGGGHSIGLPIAVAANRTFISPSATMVVHPVRLNGQVVAVSQTVEHMEKIHHRIVQFVCRHSRISEEDFRKLMMTQGEIVGDVGTILTGQEAVDCGLIDQVGTISDALKYLYNEASKRQTAPAAG